MKKLFTLSICSVLYLGLNAQSALDQFILSEMEAEHISGLSSVLVQDNEIIWYGNYGIANHAEELPVSENTIFMLASVSKTVTATAIMQLYEDGLFELNDAVNDYLPFEVFSPNFPDEVITFQQLLTHTSGIKDNWYLLPYTDGDSPVTLQDLLFNYLDQDGDDYDATQNFYSYAPNSTYNYCNVAIALCGYLVETISGIPFNTYCNENIFEPLCMENTGWFLSEVNEAQVAHPYTYSAGNYEDAGLYGYADYPDGQLRATSLSLAKFMYAHMNYGSFDEIEILDSTTVALMRSMIVPDIEPQQGIIFYSYDDQYGTWWGHNGADWGVRTMMYFDENTNTGLIILTNGEGDYGNIRTEILTNIDSLSNEFVSEIACNITTSVAHETAVSTEFVIYPNPAPEYLNIFGGKKGDVVEITDVQGRIVQSQEFACLVRIQQLESGIYFIALKTNTGNTTNRFVKQ